MHRNRQRKGSATLNENDNFLITVRLPSSFSLMVTVLFVSAKEADTMPKRRANGEGNIRKRKDGRWEGRYTVGHDPETGKAIIKNVLGKTQAEVKEKLKKAIEENVGIDYGRAKTYTVGTWLEVWMENYVKVKLRPFTFKTPVKASSKTTSNRRSAAFRWQNSHLWTYSDSTSTCWTVEELAESKQRKSRKV